MAYRRGRRKNYGRGRKSYGRRGRRGKKRISRVTVSRGGYRL